MYLPGVEPGVKCTCGRTRFWARLGAPLGVCLALGAQGSPPSQISALGGPGWPRAPLGAEDPRGTRPPGVCYPGSSPLREVPPPPLKRGLFYAPPFPLISAPQERPWWR